MFVYKNVEDFIRLLHLQLNKFKFNCRQKEKYSFNKIKYDL